MNTERRRATFERIYQSNAWAGQESRSGPGSAVSRTVATRKRLCELVNELGIKTLLDAPCGDFNWMKVLNMNLSGYVGVDIVPEIIERNREHFASCFRSFIVGDITVDILPKADLIICRDCFAHLCTHDCLAAIHNFKASGSTYLLATTSPSIRHNGDIPTGSWRALNLQLPPFSFPQPIEIIDEQSPEKLDRDKQLGLWRLDSIII
jgi:hypothetical protein